MVPLSKSVGESLEGSNPSLSAGGINVIRTSRPNGDVQRPESIEHRWDVLYRDYPEIYDNRFDTYTPDPLDRRPISSTCRKVLVDFGSARALDVPLAGERGWSSALNGEAMLRWQVAAPLETHADARFAIGRAAFPPAPGGCVRRSRNTSPLDWAVTPRPAPADSSYVRDTARLVWGDLTP